MKIAVTGATGFIGTHVINQLLEQKHEVVASSANAKKAEASVWFEKVDYVPHKISSTATEENLFASFGKPDALIHLAWQGLPNYNASYHVEENVLSNYFFLKNMLSNGLENLSVTGTCLEYGMQQGKLSEEMCAIPSTAYAVGKHSLHLYIQTLQKQFEFSLKWIRLFYMYGSGQNSNALIPQLELALERGEKKFRMSGGEQVRDFLPVEKVAENIIGISTQTKTEGAINCSSGNPIAVKKFVEEYLRMKNKTMELELGHYPYPDYEPMEFWGDHKKLLQAIA